MNDNKEEIYVPYKFKKKCRDDHFWHEMNLIDQLNIPIFDKKERHPSAQGRTLHKYMENILYG